jgi:hypothetical protein
LCLYQEPGGDQYALTGRGPDIELPAGSRYAFIHQLKPEVLVSAVRRMKTASIIEDSEFHTCLPSLQ